MITKKELFILISILLFIPAIFGIIVIYVGIKRLNSIPDLKPVTVKIDRISTSMPDPAYPIYTAHFIHDQEPHLVSLTAEGASSNWYFGSDSLEVWLKHGEKLAILRDINPTKKDLYRRYYKTVFLFGGGLTYPFLIILILYLRILLLKKISSKKSDSNEK